MRGIALADTHLGFQGTGRIVHGRNGREIDVEIAWERAVDGAIQRDPELITIAGDVFHSARPSFHAVRVFLAGLRRLSQETNAHVVIILGNHEATRTAAALSPVIVAEGLSRVHIVTQPERLTLDLANGERASIACFPYTALADEAVYRLDPDPAADVNVLLVHAAVKTSADPMALPRFYGSEYSLDVAREADKWDVIALGDFHEYRQLVPGRLAFYSGSIERTSSNIWDERQPKGFVFYDTESGEHELVEIPTRRMHDYDLIEVVGGIVGTPTAGNVNAALTMIGMQREQHDDAIVRLTINGLPRSEHDRIDWATVRALKDRCFHFHLNIEWRASDVADLGDRRTRGSRTIADEAETFFAGDPTEVRGLADEYLVAAATRRAA